MKKSNKKTISLLLAVMMAFAITACSSGGQGASQGADQAKPSSEGQTTQAVQERLPQQTNLRSRRKQPLPQPKSLPRKRKLPYHRLLQHQLQKKPLNRQNQSITSLW